MPTNSAMRSRFRATYLAHRLQKILFLGQASWSQIPNFHLCAQYRTTLVRRCQRCGWKYYRRQGIATRRDTPATKMDRRKQVSLSRARDASSVRLAGRRGLKRRLKPLPRNILTCTCKGTNTVRASFKKPTQQGELLLLARQLFTPEKIIPN